MRTLSDNELAQQETDAANKRLETVMTTIRTFLLRANQRTAEAKQKALSCTHPDDLVPLAAAFKAAAARENVLEDLLYTLENET